MKFSFTNAKLPDISKYKADFDNYLKVLNETAKSGGYTHAECSINVPFDEKNVADVLETKHYLSQKVLEYVVVVGIGGSTLGTHAIYNSLQGAFEKVEVDNKVKLIFVESISAKTLEKLFQLLKEVEPEKVILNFISKSGTTTETLANMNLILNNVSPAYTQRTVITTDKNSRLWKFGEHQNIQLLEIPQKVGGRYSALTSVGLFPLACTQIDILELLKGAMRARNDSLKEDLEANNTFRSAVSIFENYRNGKTVNENFFFDYALEYLGKWYRQLMGESLGKEDVGLTPSVALGSIDLHSMGQLYVGGAKNKFFTFVSVENPESIMKIGEDPFVIESLAGFSTDEINSAIYEGVKQTYISKDIPFMEAILEKVNEFELGYFLQFKMIEIMFLAKLLKVNAFDQPDVESFKSRTREIISKK